VKEEDSPKKSYTSPTVEQLGAVREVTLGNKNGNVGSGYDNNAQR
jgi:hypothetical protein